VLSTCDAFLIVLRKSIGAPQRVRFKGVRISLIPELPWRPSGSFQAGSALQSDWRSPMTQLSRTGVSLEDDLLKEFDRLIAKRGYANRSEAFRDLIREALLSEMVESNKPVVGTLTIVYDHHVPNLAQKLTEVQHHAGAMILAATHIHLDHNYCLEVIIMKGRGKDLQAVADGMLALRGVELGKLVLTNSGASLKHATHTH
jgi:CopG family nickel-responsive transcriptional regulator